MGARRFWAISLKRMLLGWMVVFSAGALVSYAVAKPYDDTNPLAAGLICLALFVGAGATIAVLNAISGGLYLWLFSGTDSVDSVLDDFRAIQLAPPGPRDSKSFEYLGELANDETAPTVERIRAAKLWGAYETAMGIGIFRPLALRKAIDAAMVRYAQEAPQRQFHNL